jgi:hypothetical protein
LIKIAILGSCATRDAIDISEKTEFQLVEYTARTSLASLATEPFVVEKILKNVSSAFQRRMVQRDMHKDFWHRIIQSQFDFLILDFIDDRFNLHLFDTQAAHIASSEYKKASQDTELPHKRILGPRHPDRMALWEDGMNRLVRHLSDRGMMNRILINCVFWTSIGDVKYVNDANKHLSDLYAKAASILPEKQFIRYPSNLLIENENHKWGKAPFHYDDMVYRYLLEQIKLRYMHEFKERIASKKAENKTRFTW